MGLTLACATLETSEPAHPVGNLQTMSEYHPPAPAQADPAWRVEVGGQWSQPVLAADWPG